jgi:hypothetical protein
MVIINKCRSMRTPHSSEAHVNQATTTQSCAAALNTRKHKFRITGSFSEKYYYSRILFIKDREPFTKVFRIQTTNIVYLEKHYYTGTSN